jgi:hypothetical protein
MNIALNHPGVRTVLAAVFSMFAAASQAAQPVTACDMTIDGDAYLEADLDCPTSDFAIHLKGPATLELRGFSILNVPGEAVACDGKCSVVGPGSIHDAGTGIRSIRRIDVTDVSFQENGVSIDGNNVQLENCQIEGGRTGVYVGRKLVLQNSSISGADEFGVHAGWRLHGNDPCRGGLIRLVNSDVSGNMLNPRPEVIPYFGDVVSCAMPKLDDESSCGTSRKYESDESWGACSLD